MIRTNKLKGKLLVERLKKLSQPLTEWVTMLEPPKYHNRLKNHKSITKSITNMDEDDEEVDLQQIIDELEKELENDEVDIGNFDEEDIKEFVREIFLNKLIGKE